MITSIFSNDITQALAWTLVHSIWQFTLVAVLLALTFKVLRNSKSIYRYFIGFGALGICLVMALVTFAIYYLESTQTGSGIDIQKHYQTYVAASTSVSITNVLTLLEPYLLAIVNAWLIGSILFFVKFSVSYIYLKKIIKKSLKNKFLTKTLKKYKNKYKIKREILIRESIEISTPIVMGIVKPIILFPMGLVNQLSVAEVNAILAHELAHIKRHDYLFNMLQILVETLFYFHPAIWFISNSIRNERENCCDDMAIDYTGNNVSYAKTLVKLQEISITNIQPSLGFSGSKNAFTNRILRILDQPTSKSTYKDKILVACLLFTTLFVTAENYHSPENTINDNFDVYVIDDCPQSPDDIKYYLDTIPYRNTFHIKKRSAQRDLELEMENGQITSLKINGTEVPQNELSNHSNILQELIPDQEKDIITLFPECGDFGKVYLLERLSRKAVNMDSVLDHLKENYTDFPQWQKENKLVFNFEDYNDVMIDTIKDGVQNYSHEDYPFELENNIFVDSIWDLIPHKLPQWTTNNKIPSKIKELFEGVKKERDFDLFEEKRDELFPRENKFPSWVKEKSEIEKDFLSRNRTQWNNSDRIFSNPKNSKVADVIASKLLTDGLIEDFGDTKIELSGKNMKVDGEKQPTNIWNKYKKIYETQTGILLTKDSKIVIDVTNILKEDLLSKSLFGI